MNEHLSDTPEWLECAMLPAEDPQRIAFARQVAAANDAALRDAWERETALTDALLTTLPKVQVPTGLEEKLVRIADAPATPARSGFRGWKIAAALFLMAGLIAVASIWMRGDATPPTLAPALSRSLASMAVMNANTTPDIASPDAAVVKAKLESYGFDFPVLILQPLEGTNLLGGGKADFAGTKAVYTKWESSGFHYTLYEFNGKNVGAPPLFSTVREDPQDLWRGNEHYAVVLFPGSGGKCCWALVMDKQEAPNVFARYLSGTY